jgi:DNA-directed RNA polymerase specialized sigma subunit
MLDTLEEILQQGLAPSPGARAIGIDACQPAPFLPPGEVALAEKAVMIAREQEQMVGAPRKQRGGPAQKHFLSDEGRQLILDHYDSQPKTIDWLVEQLSPPGQRIPRHVIIKWAGQLDIARAKDPPWSKDDERYLRNALHHVGPKAIARTLGRTETAVRIKAKRLGLRKIVTGGGFTLRAVCRGLGVDHHQVERWMVNGWFSGTRRDSNRRGKQRGDIWYYTAESIRELVRRHPEEIDRRRVDWTWLIEILVGPPTEEQSASQACSLQVPRPARSAYAPISDTAHDLVVTYYNGGLRRTEALAEILGAAPDEVTTWAVLLGLEQSSLHPPHIHEQGRKGRASTGSRQRGNSQVSQSLHHLLETRFNGDPGATQALADDLDLTVEEVIALAEAAGLSTLQQAHPGGSESGSTDNRSKRATAGAGVPQVQDYGSDDLIPLQAQVLLALRYGDDEIEQLAQELTRLLEADAVPIGTDLVHSWARRLGLRTRYRPSKARAVRAQAKRASRRRGIIVPLQLDAREWTYLLPADTDQTFRPDDTAPALSTVEEIRLGYLVRLGTLERGKNAIEQNLLVIEEGLRAEDRLASALLPLLWAQALARLGQGVSLEALLTVGRCGLDEAIFQFDYADSLPLFNCALPAIAEEMECLIALTSASHPEWWQPRALHRFERIADASYRLARARGRAPTIGEIASALSLTQDHVEKTLRLAIEAEGANEEIEVGAGSRRGKVTDGQVEAAFMKTCGQHSKEIIRELAEVLPLTPLTVQVKFYTLRLHTRIAERDRRREMAKQRVEARRAQGPAHLPKGHFLWDVVVDGRKQRWSLDRPYGTLAGTLFEGSRILFEGRLYEASRIFYSTLVVSGVEAEATSSEPRVDEEPLSASGSHHAA